MARIDEEEANLRRVHRRTVTNNGPDSDPVRLIRRQQADCTARRVVIGQAQHLFVLRDTPAETAVREAAMSLLVALARPYERHNAFRPEWADLPAWEPDSTNINTANAPANV